MATLPNEIKYSENLKPVSVKGSQSTMVFLPTTSGDYSANNNIIRIPVNCSKFVDMRNARLRFDLRNNSATALAGHLDHSASSVIQRISVYSPSNSLLQYTDQYNKLYPMLSDLETAQDQRSNLESLLEGRETKGVQIRLSRSTADGVYNIDVVHSDGPGAADANISRVTANWNIAGTVEQTFSVYDWTFYTSATAGQYSVSYKGFTTGLQTIGTAVSTNMPGGYQFSQTGATANLVINGILLAAGVSYYLPASIDNQFTAKSGGVVMAQNESRLFEIPLLNVFSWLNCYTPSFALGGQGVIFELQLASNRDVFCPCQNNTQPTYSLSNVALLAPCIEFDSQVYGAFNQMVQSAGSVSLSTVSYENQVYPVANATNSLSVPLSFKKKSLKAIYAFVIPSAAAGIRTCSSREFINISNCQLKLGSQYFPLQPINSPENALYETLKSVNKLSDVRNTCIVDNYNWRQSGANGGVFVLGIDLESSPLSFMENGVDNQETGQQMYLNLICSNALPASNLYIYAMFDSTLTILPNKDVVASS